MGVLRRRRRLRHQIAALLAAFILIMASAAAEMRSADFSSLTGRVGLDRAPRRLVGSSPPTCRRRCGNCRPCKAERVTIHPGVSVPLDYYPEAWRCSCRGHLFMP